MELLRDGVVVLQLDCLDGAGFVAFGLRVHCYADAGVDGCDAGGADFDGVLRGGSWGWS